MPLDDTTGLLDRKEKVKPEVFSVRGLRDWLRTQDPDTWYHWIDTNSCLLARYTRASGGTVANSRYAVDYQSIGTCFGIPKPLTKAAWGNWKNFLTGSTYRAALARCETYLSTTSGDGGE